MPEVREIQIKCLKDGCGSWFPSPIFIGDLDSFTTSTMYGNSVQCPNCGAMTPCNKENMRVRGNDGGFVGSDT